MRTKDPLFLSTAQVAFNNLSNYRSIHTGIFYSLSLCVCVCACTGGMCNKVKWLLAWPLSLLLFFTVPNCASPRWERWFMVTFISSTLWIAGFSYVMVWMVRASTSCFIFIRCFCPQNSRCYSCGLVQVTVVGFTLGIPDVIMGITFLAAGTSVPDCMASLIVARQGGHKRGQK